MMQPDQGSHLFMDMLQLFIGIWGTFESEGSHFEQLQYFTIMADDAKTHDDGTRIYAKDNI
jgi:hypothetical protein